MNLPNWKKELVEGYQSFRAGNYQAQKDLYNELGAKGQKPKVMIIACSDSRADPSDIFDTYPGEIFVVRNVANIVQPSGGKSKHYSTGAAIEYAVKHIGVEAIVVMGHEDCGGVKAYREGYCEAHPDSFISGWINVLEQAESQLHEKTNPKLVDQTDLELAGVMASIQNLMSFPFVKDAVEADQLSLMGAYFSILQGKLMFADENGNFSEVPAK
jgi:carbonic anhydrase